MFDVQLLCFEKRAVHEILWKNIAGWGRQQMTIWHMHFVCWIARATNTHSGCVILIAFPLQHCSHECASMFVICTLPLLLQKFRAKFKLQF
jgi:hypothetical protein